MRHRFHKRFALFAIGSLLAGSALFWARSGHMLPQVAVGPSGRDPRPVQDQIQTGVRTVYPYSVIPGGAYSALEVLRASKRDRVVEQHYGGLNLPAMKPLVLTAARQAYVSYRKGDKIFWTRGPVTIKAGEVVLTDGKDKIRGRCGNRISEQPMLPVGIGEPVAVADDRPADEIAVMPREAPVTREEAAALGDSPEALLAFNGLPQESGTGWWPPIPIGGPLGAVPVGGGGPRGGGGGGGGGGAGGGGSLSNNETITPPVQSTETPVFPWTPDNPIIPTLPPNMPGTPPSIPTFIPPVVPPAPPGTPPIPSLPPEFPPSAPPSGPPASPPSTPTNPPGTPPRTPPGLPPGTPPYTPPGTPPDGPPGGPPPGTPPPNEPPFIPPPPVTPPPNGPPPVIPPNNTPPDQPVPEPAMFIGVGGVLIALALWGRDKKKKRQSADAEDVALRLRF